jgi:hypothetical protein
VVKIEPAIFTAFVHDSRNAQAPEVLQHASALGTTFLGSATVPLTVAGLDGFYSVRAAYSTKQGTDFTDIPQLFLPPDAQSTIDAKVARWYFAYSSQQYLMQNPADRRQGWGVFGQYVSCPLASSGLDRSRRDGEDKAPPSGGRSRLSPLIAGAAMALSSVSVVSNALLLRRWRPAANRRA